MNLAEPGWTVKQGLALWQPRAQAPEIAGDLVVAAQADGRTWVQLSKMTIPLVTAQTTPDRWQIELHPQNRRFAGSGTPPSGVIWLHVVRCLHGGAPPKGWAFSQPRAREWLLQNAATGERVEGFFWQ